MFPATILAARISNACFTQYLPFLYLKNGVKLTELQFSELLNYAVKSGTYTMVNQIFEYAHKNKVKILLNENNPYGYPLIDAAAWNNVETLVSLFQHSPSIACTKQALKEAKEQQHKKIIEQLSN